MRKVFTMFTDWASDTDQNKIHPVLPKFAAYCQPLKNVPFERYLSFILECTNRESLMITVRQLFDSVFNSGKVRVRINYPQSDIT